MFGDRRKTGGPGFGPRLSTAITPTKRFTDVGPTSVRKADSRLSMGQGGGQPRASLFQRSSAVASRDVKSLMAANVNKIYNFFIESEGSEAPSEAQIRNPKGRNDFITFFELLYQHLSCDYEFPQGARVEDEVSALFKNLGYPTALKNSFFQPMGSSHGYPHLIDALAWLVDLIRCNMCVSNDTQNIIFGDFLEQSKVQERTLSYCWMSSTYKEYTNDRKAAETRDGPFWDSTKIKLRKYFEDMNETGDMAASAKTSLEQLRFECEEIEADKGTEQNLIEEIAKIKDDFRKASDYCERLEAVERQREVDLDQVKMEVDVKKKEMSEVQEEVNSLKQRIEEQKQNHGLTGKQVRQLNSDNSRDKAIVSEIQSELERLSKELWLRKNEENFKEKKTMFLQLAEKLAKIGAGINVDLGLTSLRSPQNEKELKIECEKLVGVWLPEVTRHLNQKKLELEMEKSRFNDKFASAKACANMEQETLCEAQKKAAREERIRRNEREEWTESRLAKEKRYDELENELDVLKKNMQMGDSLVKEIEMERAKKVKLCEEQEKQKKTIEASIRQKMDQIMTETAEIDNEKMMIHVECNELEKMVQRTRNLM